MLSPFIPLWSHSRATSYSSYWQMERYLIWWSRRRQSFVHPVCQCLSSLWEWVGLTLMQWENWMLKRPSELWLGLIGCLLITRNYITHLSGRSKLSFIKIITIISLMSKHQLDSLLWTFLVQRTCIQDLPVNTGEIRIYMTPQYWCKTSSMTAVRVHSFHYGGCLCAVGVTTYTNPLSSKSQPADTHLRKLCAFCKACIEVSVNSFPPNDTIWCHHGHGLSTSQWKYIWGF